MVSLIEWTELAPGIQVERRGKRKSITWITHGGRTQNAHQWGAELGIDSQVILFRLRHGRMIAEALDPRKLRYQRPAVVYERPPMLPAGMLPEWAAAAGLITADQYLDCFREPRRAWGRP